MHKHKYLNLKCNGTYIVLKTLTRYYTVKLLKVEVLVEIFLFTSNFLRDSANLCSNGRSAPLAFSIAPLTLSAFNMYLTISSDNLSMSQDFSLQKSKANLSSSVVSFENSFNIFVPDPKTVLRTNDTPVIRKQAKTIFANIVRNLCLLVFRSKCKVIHEQILTGPQLCNQIFNKISWEQVTLILLGHDKDSNFHTLRDGIMFVLMIKFVLVLSQKSKVENIVGSVITGWLLPS
ncbi:hypothetical protein AGLY_007839 [Aphis glycines]|uniref:Uncharacterized protein n=1 Tax=Aphis glycines TaxID=307491 RepID=A0A6G0TNB9_APHGL|nr:hypothetical protein AGLY_007839 [Aphis glycines]